MRAATGTKIAPMYHHSSPGVFIFPYSQVVSGVCCSAVGGVDGGAAGGVVVGAGAGAGASVSVGPARQWMLAAGRLP